MINRVLEQNQYILSRHTEEALRHGNLCTPQPPREAYQKHECHLNEYYAGDVDNIAR